MGAFLMTLWPGYTKH